MTKLYAAPTNPIYTRVYLSLILLILLSFSSFASDRLHMIPATLEERVKEAEIVIEGEVISRKSFWDSRHENIYTSNIIRVYKVFKGEVQEKEIELITAGGTVGLKMHVNSAALELNQGEQGIFFLSKNQPIQNTPGGKQLKARAYAGKQGFIDYDLTGGNIHDVFNTYSSVQEVYNKITSVTGNAVQTSAENEKLNKSLSQTQRQEQSVLAVPVVASFDPMLASAGTGTVLTINGSGFGATRGSGMVQFLDANSGGKDKNTLIFMTPLPREYISWSDTQIRMFIPSTGVQRGTAGTGPIRITTNDGSTFTTAQQIVIEYAYSNVSFNNRSFKPILINSNSQGGYTIQLAPSIQSRNAARDGFVRAVNSWICATQVNWDLSTTTVERATDDGLNVIQFVSPSQLVSERTLASTISRYEGCASSVARDTLFWLTEFDMQINNNINWQFGPGPPVNEQYDFETIVLHELGHAHQLGHVILPRALMHFEIEFERMFRDLDEVDVRGGTFVMANSTGSNFCDEPPMIPEPEGDCNLAPEIFTIQGAFQDSQVVLNWQTREEITVDFFEVQRSANGTNWTDIATVDAKGPSTGTLNYTFTDTDPLPDVSFYRLRIVYLDGSARFSPRIRVVDPSSLRKIRVYPNPVPPDRHSISVLFLVQNNTPMTIRLVDMAGKVVREYTVTFTDVNMPVNLPIDGLASGMYILKWQELSNDNTGEQKIIRL